MAEIHKVAFLHVVIEGREYRLRFYVKTDNPEAAEKHVKDLVHNLKPGDQLRGMVEIEPEV